jgi:tRNA-specific 2-thiouridylase
MNKKVIVAMSGGVDSSTAALLLKNKGYNVQGIFLDFFGNKRTIKDVKEVSNKIGIPLEIVDASKDFKKKVINYFLEELKNGNTPNPCVVCNKEIKFAIMLKKMLELKADYVATGHYARVIKHKTHNMKYEFGLFEAKDRNKDQSYFLYKLGQKELSKTIFPLGDHTKVEVRKMAKEFGLPVHDKKESQDVCFIPENGYETFLKKDLRLKKGKICDLKGKILGEHNGLPLYTIGQRKGIKIGGNGPYYVIRKDFKKNVLIVGGEKELFGRKIMIKDVNWISEAPKLPSKLLLRTRYRNPLVHGIINKDTRYEILFSKPQKAVTSGQSAVFYSKEREVIGGGTIV